MGRRTLAGLVLLALAATPGFLGEGREPGIALGLKRHAGQVQPFGQGQALFENGQPSGYVNFGMEFCNNFEQERVRTESLASM